MNQNKDSHLIPLVFETPSISINWNSKHPEEGKKTGYKVHAIPLEKFDPTEVKIDFSKPIYPTDGLVFPLYYNHPDEDTEVDETSCTTTCYSEYETQVQDVETTSDEETEYDHYEVQI